MATGNLATYSASIKLSSMSFCHLLQLCVLCCSKTVVRENPQEFTHFPLECYCTHTTRRSLCPNCFSTRIFGTRVLSFLTPKTKLDTHLDPSLRYVGSLVFSIRYCIVNTKTGIIPVFPISRPVFSGIEVFSRNLPCFPLQNIYSKCTLMYFDF
jgi:hypothetical protein